MGASKEGMMRVREKINLVLSDPDPEDGCSGSTAADCDASFISKAGGERVEDRGVGGSGNFRSFERNHLDHQQQAGKFTGQTQGPTSSAVSDVCSKNGVERLLCRRHVEILQILGKQKREAETTYMTVSSERDQLAISLQSEREERARLQQVNASLLEQKNRAEDTVKQKEEMIIELQRQLLIANSKKLVEEKSTCTSPRPLSPPSSSPSEQPPLKRARLDNNENSFALPPPPEATGTIQMRFENIKSSSSSSSVSFNIHRSNSPPQLSPAVTPRSLSQKSYSGSRNSVKALFGFDDDEESDDFEDELQCLTTTPLQEADKPSSSTSYFAPQDSPVPTSQHSAFACSSSDRADDYFNSTFFPGESSPNSHSSHLDKHSNSPDILKFKPIQRPRPNNFFRHHHGRTLQPEVRRRFNTSSLIRSRLPDASKQLNSFFAPKNFSNDNANNFQSTSISTPSQSQQAISVRNNNFLNVSRSVPSSKDLSSSSSSLIPTDDISGGQENHTQSFRSLSDFDRINEEGMPETVTSPSKKRAVGRPPGSIKKRVPGPSTPAVFSSPSPGPSSSNSNGVVEQKFSKRGRLLKPNRARYSPDPDISVNSREKCITTRKSYFMPESAAQEEEESPEAPPTTPAPPVVEEEPVSSAPCDVVEVPKWRINVVEGYEYELDRPIPDDDMSDEAFLKRHQKLEAKEKQRKRWDSQRLREETYREKLRMRQEERERQKELRRLQRKRKGRAGCTSDEEQESLLPTIDDVKAIFISPELPVGAFGFTLPLVEKVDFQLLWRPEVRNYINISTEMPTTTTTDKVLNPSPSSLIPSSLQSLPPVSSQKPELSASCSISSNSIPLIDLDTNSARRNNSNFVSDSIGTGNCSADSFTDSRVCSGVGKGIVVEFDNKSNTETNRKLLSNPSSFDVTTTITITEELGECSSPTPIFTIDLVDFRNENNTDSNGSSSGSSSSRTNVSDDNDVLPSITIPSSSRYHCESSRNSSKKETCDSMASKVVDIGLLKVSCPPLSYSVSNNTNVVSSTSFKFVIPTNPLAPRQSSPGSLTRPPPVSSPPKPGPRSQNNVVSTLSQVSEADEMCRDNIRS